METTLSIDELKADIGAALDRVLDGERVIVERDGLPIALIVPPERGKVRTWSEIVALVRAAPRPDPGFADDLEAIQNGQGPAEFPEWRD